MSERDLLDRLIATYRELNVRVRPLPEERLTLQSADGGSIRDLIRDLRDRELRFSQALKERITGVPMPDVFASDDTPLTGAERSTDSTAVLLSQFGTARESTLAMLRGLPAEMWDEQVEGGRTIAERVRELVEDDREHVERINSLLGAP